MLGWRCPLALLLAVHSGCADKERAAKKIDPAYIAENVLTEAPAQIQNRVDASLGGYVIYLGNDVDPKTLEPGAKATVVHYWKVVTPPGSEWRVFTHLVGTGDDWMNLDASDMRIGYPPGSWKAGDVIRDEQSFTVGASWKSTHAQLTVGLYRKGGGGPEDRMPIESGPADKDSRVLAFRFPVGKGKGKGKGKAPPKPPDYLIRRASGPITVDGKADEEDWKGATASPAFTSAEGGPEVGGATQARLLWDDANLYAFIQVADADVASPYKAQDDTLWKADVVELFIDADRNRRGYVELQVNPRNAHFDAWFPRTRAEPHHFEWTSKMKSAVTVRGTLDKRDDKDEGWDVEIAVPLEDVKGMDAAMALTLPPAVGDRWRLNIVRVEKPAEGPLGAASLGPITIQDFHALGRMVTVVFADAEGVAPPPRATQRGKPADGDPPDGIGKPAEPAAGEAAGAEGKAGEEPATRPGKAVKTPAPSPPAP